MSRFLSFLSSKSFIQFLGIVALYALIWFAGPLVAIAGTAPLEPAAARWLSMGTLLVMWIIYRMLMQIRAMRKDRRLMAELAEVKPGKSAVEEASEEEVESLRRNFEEALKILRSSLGQGEREGAQFLYELPWYVIIGAPGSGKTTALVNSGLKFPLSEKLGKNAIKGVSGTRNCEWWFTDQAVLLDTAGRYTTQDSHQAVDAAAWLGFLQLVKQHRPRRPLNGLLVTMSLSDLIRQTEEERALHAKALRRRIEEMYDTMGVRLPVYLLFTKADLVAGFNDFFADLSAEERAQVWGETFPSEKAGESTDFIDHFRQSYLELLQRLNQRSLKRIQEERDVQRRGLILEYPQQMAMLATPIQNFLEAVFTGNRFEQHFLLRGVYFTSGTQEGTPIDRVLGILASTFRLDRVSAPVYSGRGKSFFLTRLLTEVVFPEAELAGVDPKVEHRQRLLQLSAYAGVLLLSALAVAAWTVSYQRNLSAIDQVEAEVERYRAIDIKPTDTKSNFVALAPRLNALLAARDVYRDHGWLMGFGLYQGDKLQAAANYAYENLLKHYFLPAIGLRLKERMQGNEAGGLDLLYQFLQVYLMLGQPDRMDPRVAEPWIKVDWEQHFTAQPELQAQLSIHLRNLLQMPLEPASLDQPFIASVRARLSQVPQVLQLYTRFRGDALADHAHDLNLGDVLGPQGSKVFTTADGRDLSSAVVPGLYTAYGYSELFLKKSLAFVKESVEQNWVLGDQAAVNPAEVKRLHDDFRKLYLADYQKAWDGLINGVRLKKGQTLNQTVQMLDVLSRPDTPLRTLLETLDKNTSLTRIASLAAELLAKAGVKADEKQDERAQKLLDAARQAANLNAGAADDPAHAVEAHFDDLNYLVRKEADKPAPLDATIGTLGRLRDYVMQIGSSADSGGQALRSAASRVAGGSGQDVLRDAQLQFSYLPDPVKGWLASLTSFGWSQTLAGAKGQLNDLLKTQVGSACSQAFAGRYPFVQSSTQDATLADFARFFAPSGIFDQFFESNLKPFIDTTRAEWRELSLDNRSLGLSAATIRQFQYAAKIRDAFFPSGGKLPQMHFELKPLALDNTVATFRLIVEGQEAIYRHGPEQVSRFQWPGPGTNAGVRMVFETLDGRQASRTKHGPWAWFRALDEASVEPTVLPERFNVGFQLEGYSVRYELQAGSVNSPMNLPELHLFRCPGAL